MEYKYEIHCHTKNVSKCGKMDAADIAKLYKDAGFSGIVITDHYAPMTFNLKELLSKKAAAKKFFEGYRKAKELEDENFTVLPGIELRFYGTVNDYLVYGAEEKELCELPHLLPLYLRRASGLLRKKGCVIIQAHPFRKFITRANPKYLDGVEIYNGKTSKELNDKALEWANTFEKKPILTGGSDCHSEKQFGTSGIITTEKIKTKEDLVKILRSGNYRIYENAY